MTFCCQISIAIHHVLLYLSLDQSVGPANTNTPTPLTSVKVLKYKRLHRYNFDKKQKILTFESLKTIYLSFVIKLKKLIIYPNFDSWTD